MRLLDQGETYFPGGLSSNRINGLCSHVHGYHLIRPLVPAADTRANICNGSNLLKSRRSVSNHVAQLQKWRISTTLLEQHARDSGCGGGEGWSVSYTRICTDSLSLIQRLCECSGGPRPLAPYGIVRGSLGIEPLPINKRDWPGSQQLLLLCVMDHPAHSNNEGCHRHNDTFQLQHKTTYSQPQKVDSVVLICLLVPDIHIRSHSLSPAASIIMLHPAFHITRYVEVLQAYKTPNYLPRGFRLISVNSELQPMRAFTATIIAGK